MSSGHGLNSKQGRCYPFWSEVARCREQVNATPEKCAKYVEDFMECLFHKKEKNKLMEMIRALDNDEVTSNSDTTTNKSDTINVESEKNKT